MIGLEKHPCDEGLVWSERATTDCTEQTKRWVLVATVLGSSVAFINGSVVNVALPAIQEAFEASARSMQWIVNGYALFVAALILAGGSAGDRFGQRRVFVIGISVFTAASIWCGLAPNSTQLILARVLEGIGGALLIPASLAILARTFEKEERGKAIGAWAGFAALTTAAGPLVGGWLIDSLSWRWVFFIIVPVALAALGITIWRMPALEPERDTPGLDVPGALLATVGLGVITYGLIEASELGLSNSLILGCMLVGLGMLGLFLVVEWRSPDPMMPVELFRSTTFTGANLLTLFLYFALGGMLFFLPFNLIQVQGYSATAAGAAFLPFTLLVGGLSRWSGGLVERFGAKKPLVVGPVITGIGFALFAVPGIGGSYWTTFFPAMTTVGLGMAVSVAPLTTVVMSAVEERRAGVASGINNTASRVAWLLAVAVLGTLAVSLFGAEMDRRLMNLDLPGEVRRVLYEERVNLAAAEVPAEIEGSRRIVLEQAIDASFVKSFRIIMFIAAGLAFVSAVCAALLIDPAMIADEDASVLEQ